MRRRKKRKAGNRTANHHVSVYRFETKRPISISKGGISVNTTDSRKTPSLGLSILVFVVIAACIGYGILGLGLDAHMPILVAALFAACVGFFFLRVPWTAIEEGMLTSITVALQATVILMIVGILIGTWILGGVVPGLISYGLAILNPSIFLVATLLICSIVSLATGSSWTTSGTVGIAMLGIANGLGIPAPLAAGVIISGAYFGDKMSPLSDTTNLAPAVAGSTLFDHIRAMCWTTGPSYLIVLAILAVIGTKYGSGTVDTSRVAAIQALLGGEFSISLLCLVPPILVIASAVLKVPAIPGLFVGVVAGCLMAAASGFGIADILGAAHYGYESTFAAEVAGAADEAAVMALLAEKGITIAPDLAKEVGEMISKLVNRGGMDSMMWSISLIFVALSLGGIMEACGFLEVIIGTVTKNIRKVGTLVAAVVASSVISNIFLGDQYLSLVIPGRMFKTTFEKTGLAPRMLSRTLEDAGTLTSALVPWNTCGAYQSSVLGVATLAYAPYAFLNYINPFVAILMSYLGIGIYWRNEKGEDVIARKADF
jgi:NhaC family Na+:H+ antiporter